MVREFKKVGAAAAVAGALLGSSASYATVQLSSPGDFLLVPRVICDTSVPEGRKNTLIGLITFWKDRIGLVNDGGFYQPAPPVLANVVGQSVPTLPERVTTPGGGKKGLVHWYFYNNRSEHLLDGVIPVTDNDFVRVDWCSVVTGDPNTQATLDGVEGYMLFVDNTYDSEQIAGLPFVVGMPKFALYGHAYQIVGNWASQAFIPVLSNPVCTYNSAEPVPGGDCRGTQAPNTYWLNVTKGSDGYPKIDRLISGIDFTTPFPANFVRDIYVRYFLDPALATKNEMVFWFNRNSTDSYSRSSSGETYDSEQVYQRSFSVDLPDELNVIVSTPTVPAFPGMIHEEVEVTGGDAAPTVVNTGIIRFGVPEFKSTIEWSASGVVFNMLGLGAGSNAAQLQTEMATEGSEF